MMLWLITFIGLYLTVQASTVLTVYHQKDGQFIKRGEIVGLPGVPEYVPLQNEIVDFKSKRDSFYEIKVRDESTGKIYLQSTKMCQMVASDWHDEFTLHLDENNQFYHFDYYSTSSICPAIDYPVTTKPFSTTVHVAKSVPAPKPLLGHFASQQQKTQSKKPVVKVNDEIPQNKEIEEKSFFQKYWYLILAAGMFLMSASGGPPPEAPARRQ
ncbi:ER membrane protein complex subunit 10 [Choanephora cucurbitarum]|uniref:ER membrane protein complex subunit 10 n=1 Tax=Choanephora cucurbitarum TaxID=101091 RepID=A0A1C7NRX3_9FUNG|nr:ER membrane protein complex subunit 10 [Choanephora cucurbitarum]